MKYKFTEEKVPATEKKPSQKKTHKPIKTPETNKTETKIDSDINALVNERILRLVQIGLKHELTIENMMQYFREVNKSKLYELKRYFSDSQLSDISDMLQYLFKQKILKRDVNKLYSLKSK